MFLGAAGSFVSSAGGFVLNAASSVASEVVSVAEAHPVIAALAVGYELYEHSNSTPSNPGNLGNHVDTAA
jgi:hypothetical protein